MQLNADKIKRSFQYQRKFDRFTCHSEANKLWCSNSAQIPALVPLLLIISSSVYLAVISSIENKELLVIAEAAVQLRGDNQRDTDTINHYVYRSHIRGPSLQLPQILLQQTCLCLILTPHFPHPSPESQY